MLIRLGFRALMFFMSLILFGCASDKIVKTYEGKVLPQDAIAVLTAPENITVLSVNGVGVQEYLLSSLNVNYGLKAGENLVVFKYASIWSRAKKDQETGLRVDVVESDPLEVLIGARPGAKYNFNFLPANNVREAKELASAFAAQVIDAQKNLVAESVALNTFQSAKDKLQLKEQALMLEKEANKHVVLSSDGASVIDQLKAIWPSANADEKKEFLVWVFQK
tara:strand:+ start:7186 stop:7851 length:666 start_codon:yes stop_codon:yes gene_type:complete